MLIDDIVDQLSRDSGSLNEALLKTKVLLHLIGKKDLVGWVNSELSGYASNGDLPDYRKVGGRVLANIAAYTFTAQSHPIPMGHLTPEERERLERHQIREPISVLESRDGDGKLVVPIPMEFNGRLGQGLASDVRINSAWSELNGNQISAIPINVRSRLLEFILELRDAIGPNAADAELSKKASAVDASALFTNAIFGPNTTVIVGSGSANITVDVQSGNFASLEQTLQHAGVSAEEIAALQQAIAADAASETAPLEGEVGSWFTRLLGKAAKGTIGIGVAVVSSTVSKALLTYLGAG